MVLPSELQLDDSVLVDIVKSVEELAAEVDINVINVWCQQVVPQGGNYLSRLYRVTVDYKIESDSAVKSSVFILKQPLQNGILKEFVESIKGYDKEFRMYKEVIPAMYNLTKCLVTARSFSCPLANTVVLEDLKPKGYMMADRLKQLDYHHCRKFFESLARFHGMSVALHSINPELIESVGENVIFTDAKEKELRSMTEGFMRGMVNTIEKLDGCEQFAEKIRSKISSHWERMVDLFTPSEVLNVLNHGDAWTNNILFLYDSNGAVVDVKLVDFQLCQYGMFTLDIIFFWWTSANDTVRENHMEEIFEVYRDTLNSMLKSVGKEGISKEQFDSAIRKSAPYSLTVMSDLLAVALADPEDLLDYNEFSPDDFGKELTDECPEWKNFRSKYYRAVLPNMLQQAEKLGAFE